MVLLEALSSVPATVGRPCGRHSVRTELMSDRASPQMNEGRGGILRDCASAFPGRRAPSAGEPERRPCSAGEQAEFPEEPAARTPALHAPVTAPAKDGWHGRLAPKAGRPPPKMSGVEQMCTRESVPC